MPKKQKEKTSLVWNYYEIVKDNSAQCQLCEKVILRTRGSTSGLKRHLKCKHRDAFTDMLSGEPGKIDVDFALKVPTYLN